MPGIYRAALIGCGRIGSEFDDDPKRKEVSSHAGAYSATPRTRLVAVSDISAEKLEKCRKKWGVPSAYPDYREMLAKEKPDIVSICTWSPSHLEIVQEAAKHGAKAIFCEKPMADTLESARKIIGICKKGGIILAVNHKRRFDLFHQNVRRMVTGGKLGKMQQATFYYVAGIANSGTHMLDLLRFYLGDAEWVQGDFSAAPSGKPDDPNIDAQIRFRNGATAMLQSCDVKGYYMFDMELFGTKGRVSITKSGFGGEYYSAGESDVYSGYSELFPKSFPFDKDTPREYLKQAVSHIVDCIDAKKEPACGGEDGLAALELICALHESAKNGGRKVTLPLEHSDVKIV